MMITDRLADLEERVARLERILAAANEKGQVSNTIDTVALHRQLTRTRETAYDEHVRSEADISERES